MLRAVGGKPRFPGCGFAGAALSFITTYRRAPGFYLPAGKRPIPHLT